VAAGGRTPRHFALDPSGRWLLVAHQGSDAITTVRIDEATRVPSPIGRPLALSRPVCVVFASAITPR
jgi:6-phosphogluconolactonase